jgi:hypothetical protein
VDIQQVIDDVDSSFGQGYSALNPGVVAQVMQARATQAIANELAELREIISSGSGGITVGIER